ncbi:response regulator [Spirosoma rhododendri]|uniref:response regulator n=1 Tax=Spirosoma rhododendri TaxID=2728024 RepID=UPI002FCDC7E5
MNTYQPTDIDSNGNGTQLSRTSPELVPTVWVVDDDDDDQTFIELAFGVMTPAVNVLPLTDGASLLTRLSESETAPRLIILDINMPGLDGFDTLRQIRSQLAYANIPVVMMTTSSNSDDRDKSLALGLINL